jgi:hypothetical protein
MAEEANAMATTRKQSGYLIQGNFGSRGNFELVIPCGRRGLAHYWRGNDTAQFPWHGPNRFGRSTVAATSLIQGNFGRRGNFEVVARVGSRLVHYWRANDRSGFPWYRTVTFGSGVAGNPSLIQGNFGQRGNFEVVVPRAAGGLSHYWRANNTSGYPWHGPNNFGRGRYDEVALIQGNFGRNLEVVARRGSTLHHYWRESNSPFRWHGPHAIGRECLRLHFKILSNPTSFSVAQMLASMRQVYQAHGFRVELLSTESLNLPVLNDVDVGACTMGGVTAEQTQLFNNRNSVGANDIVIYFVRSTVPAYNGCAAHPAGRPGAVVASVASQWTLAHEIGHVLGLNHVNNNDRLMTGNGTSNITNPPPNLVNTEVSTMGSSNLTPACTC